MAENVTETESANSTKVIRGFGGYGNTRIGGYGGAPKIGGYGGAAAQVGGYGGSPQIGGYGGGAKIGGYGGGAKIGGYGGSSGLYSYNRYGGYGSRYPSINISGFLPIFSYYPGLTLFLFMVLLLALFYRLWVANSLHGNDYVNRAHHFGKKSAVDYLNGDRGQQLSAEILQALELAHKYKATSGRFKILPLRY